MTIKNKTLVICTIVTAICMLLVYLMTKVFIVGNILNSEQNAIKEDLRTAVKAIAYDLSTVENFATDWATWDDTYRFVEEVDQEYIDKNMHDGTFKSQRLNMMIFVNNAGEVKHSKWFDLTQEQEVIPTASFQASILEYSELVHHKDHKSVSKGLVASPNGPMLIVSKPIINSLGQMPVRGSLIVGRYLNEAELELLSTITNLKTELTLTEDSDNSSGINIAETAHSELSAEIYTKQDIVSGTTKLQDLSGTNKYILSMHQPRTYYRQSIQMLRFFLVSMCATMALFGLMIFLLIDRHVLSSLVALTQGIGRIKGFEDVSENLVVKGNDEVSLLAGKLAELFSELKASHDSLQFLSTHDTLTGLYNRRYFELYVQELEVKSGINIGVIVCDMDGLKLANDVAGHAYGDELLQDLAGVLRNANPENAVLFRIGGDEFIIIVEVVTEEELSVICKNIQYNIEELQHHKQHSIVPLSVSVGYTISVNENYNINDLVRKADTLMYREKLLCNQSKRSGLVQTLKSALEARDYLTEGHAHRMAVLAVALARHSGISIHKLPDLQLFAEFHDVGKIGIPDSILFKKGRLNPKEQAEMQKHCEIGFRIAQSTQDLRPIANLVLSHHEWWNGAGYPSGLTGENIPEECRLLAIVDAYDAMTNDRPYRQAMTSELAVQELRRCAGIQFDPVLVTKFIEVLAKEELQVKNSSSAS